MKYKYGELKTEQIEKQKKLGLNYIELEEYKNAYLFGKWYIKLRRKLVNFML